MIAHPAPDPSISALRFLQSAVGVVAIALTVIALLFAGNGSVPTWLGILVTAGVGTVSAFSARWYRRRPIPPARFDVYRQTIIVRMMLALDVAIIGAVMAFVGESAWPAVVGVLLTILVLALAPVSSHDYVRHQMIHIEANPDVPAEAWGAADPAAEAPWESLEEGHGHGLSH